MTFDVIDLGDDDNQERKTRARRMEMYSVEAIGVAREVARRYVLFNGLKDVLAAFDRVYQLSRDLELPQGVLVTGPPGSSKTSVAEYFAKSLPPTPNVVEGFGTAHLRMRPGITAGLVVSQVLNAVRHPFTNVRHDRVSTMRDIACEALQHRGTRILFVDEAHCLGMRGRGRLADDRETSACNMLREFMDRGHQALVLLGDQRLQDLENVDRALANRVSVRMSLTHFGNDGSWGSFLRGFARDSDAVSLALLSEASMCSATHAATGGCRRTVARLITEAVLIAVDADAKEVTRAHFHLAFQRTSGPSHMAPNPYGSP